MTTRDNPERSGSCSGVRSCRLASRSGEASPRGALPLPPPRPRIVPAVRLLSCGADGKGLVSAWRDFGVSRATWLGCAAETTLEVRRTVPDDGGPRPPRHPGLRRRVGDRRAHLPVLRRLRAPRRAPRRPRRRRPRCSHPAPVLRRRRLAQQRPAQTRCRPTRASARGQRARRRVTRRRAGQPRWAPEPRPARRRSDARPRRAVLLRRLAAAQRRRPHARMRAARRRLHRRRRQPGADHRPRLRRRQLRRPPSAGTGCRRQRNHRCGGRQRPALVLVRGRLGAGEHRLRFVCDRRSHRRGPCRRESSSTVASYSLRKSDGALRASRRHCRASARPECCYGDA